MDCPSFSIVIPTYRRRDTVCDAVRHIAAIRYEGAFELIVSVDGSDDGTQAALAQLALPCPMRILDEPNGGAAAARNRGAAAAGGDIILFLDDDMMAAPDILTQHAAEYAAGADAVLGHIPLDPGSRPGFLSAQVGQWASDRKKALSSDEPIPLEEFISGHVSIRRTVFTELGGFDTRFTRDGLYGNEDLDLGQRLFGEYSVRFAPGATSSHRYLHGPRATIRQRYMSGRADVALALKHPALAADLFARRGIDHRGSRWLIRPLARLPWLARPLVAAGSWIAERFEQAPGLWSPLVSRLFESSRQLSYWMGVNDAGGIGRNGRVRVLCYHAIGDLSGDDLLREYGVSAGEFATQLDQLTRRGFTFIGPENLAAFLDCGAPIPRRAVLLTFDDCYAELADVARDILAPRGISALAFAVTGQIGQTNAWDTARGAPPLKLLDAEGLRAARLAGMEIGAHSRRHVHLTDLAGDDLRAETEGAASDLETLGLPRPRYFAYPYGASDTSSRAVLRTAGYLAGFGLRAGAIGRGADRYDLPRVEVLRRDTGWRFKVKTAFPHLAALSGWKDTARHGFNLAFYGTGRAVRTALGLRRTGA